jgi:hypothetical protein
LGKLTVHLRDLLCFVSRQDRLAQAVVPQAVQSALEPLDHLPSHERRQRAVEMVGRQAGSSFENRRIDWASGDGQ